MTSSRRESPVGHLLYRFIRRVNRAFALAVLWTYIGAFVLAFSLMFVFPPGTLLLVFLGVFGLVAAVGGAQLLGGTEHFLARSLIRREWCPRCGRSESLTSTRGYRSSGEEQSGGGRSIGGQSGGERAGGEGAARTVCRSCGAAFEAWGGEIEAVPPIAFAGGVPGGASAALSDRPDDRFIR